MKGISRCRCAGRGKGAGTGQLQRALTGSPGPNEAAVAPDWMGWVAAAGLISFAASRFSKWRRIRPRFPWGLWNRQGVNETGKSWWRMSLPKPHLRPGVPLLSARVKKLTIPRSCAAQRV